MSKLPLKSGTRKINGKEVRYEGINNRNKGLRKEIDELNQEEYNLGRLGSNRRDVLERELDGLETVASYRAKQVEEIRSKYGIDSEGNITMQNLRKMLS